MKEEMARKVSQENQAKLFPEILGHHIQLQKASGSAMSRRREQKASIASTLMAD